MKIFQLQTIKKMMCASALCVTVTGMAFAGGGLPDHQFWLITPEEAALAPAAPESQGGAGGPLDEIGAEFLQDIGPIVELIKPNTDEPLESPVEVLIKFSPRLAKVDLNSLRVEVEKFINFDITYRIKPYATETGIHIPDAPFPSGDHTIIFYIEDEKGNPTEMSITITVV